MQPTASTSMPQGTRRESLFKRYAQVRAYTREICENLTIEDHVVQPCPEVSPPKWHLAHTTWFFEEMLLARFVDNYQRYDNAYNLLFNSYYKAAGKHWIQAERGQLSRPTVNEVMDYRDYVDEKVMSYLENADANDEVDDIIELGLHHEQQHQELLYMDIKSIFAINPSLPTYSTQPLPSSPSPVNSWLEISEGVYETGHSDQQFAYDNERPRHKNYLYPFAISNSLVTNGDYLAFIEDGGYNNPAHWLSKGYDFIQQYAIKAPLYWHFQDGERYEFSLHGLLKLNPNTPVCHISYFEACAYADWRGLRLPTEHEYETAFEKDMLEDADKSSLALHPYNANLCKQLWCWTSSHYSPYPGFKAFLGPLQEYNGKFMCNQFVLRGGCIATPAGHLRPSYRNFYEPHQRWMFSGIRLAKDLT